MRSINKISLSVAILALSLVIPSLANAKQNPANIVEVAVDTAQEQPKAIAPETADFGSSASPSAPATESGSSASPVPPATADFGSSAAPVAPVTNPTSGLTSTSYSSGGSSSVYVASLNSCSTLTSYMKKGGNNDSEQVKKLQTLLNQKESANLVVNGIFDDATEMAVKNFQAKYINDTMGPWGANTPSGVVYITTLKKLNNVACNAPLSLNYNELSTINSYKNSAVTNTVTPENTSTEIGSAGPVLPVVAQVTSTSSNDGGENTASVAKTGIFTKFKNFVKRLLGL